MSTAIKSVLKYIKTLPQVRKEDKGQRILAERLGVSEEWLSKVLNLDKKAPKEVKRAWKEGRIATSTAVELQKLEPETQVEILPQIEEIPRHEIREIIKETKEEEKAKKLFDDEYREKSESRKLEELRGEISYHLKFLRDLTRNQKIARKFQTGILKGERKLLAHELKETIELYLIPFLEELIKTKS